MPRVVLVELLNGYVEIEQQRTAGCAASNTLGMCNGCRAETANVDAVAVASTLTQSTSPSSNRRMSSLEDPISASRT